MNIHEVSSGPRTYTSDQLKSFNRSCLLRRAVRKSLFAFGLWQPRRCRSLPDTESRSVAHDLSQAVIEEVNNNNERRNVDMRTKLSVGWLNVQSLRNKPTAICETIDDRQLDVAVLTEAWHGSSDDICLRLATPSDFSTVDAVRKLDPDHGGIVVLYRSCYRCVVVPLPDTVTFEALCLRLTDGGESITLLSIYRPGTRPPPAAFYDELAMVFEMLVQQCGAVVVGGDINIHVEKLADPDAVRFADLLQSFDMVQHVVGPTQKSGGTLDHVITFADYVIDTPVVDPPGVLSDHSLVVSCLPFARHVAPPTNRRVRSWRMVDLSSFRDAITNSPLGHLPPTSAGSSELFDIYCTELRRIADLFAPEHWARSRVRPLSPWFDAECRAIRRNCRRLERRYRRSKSDEDRAEWTKAVRQKHIDFLSKKNDYWTHRLLMESRVPVKLWKSVTKILGRERDINKSQPPLIHTADGFQKFFKDKVESVRMATAGHSPPIVPCNATSSLAELQVCTEDDVRRVIMGSPTKSCSLDPIPTTILKECIDVLIVFLTAMCNASLTEGHLPQSQRHAVVTPLLKKLHLDQAELKNYRPVSNLSFMSKVVERMVADRLNQYLQVHDLMPRLQSAYRRHHSTETALLRVISDLCSSADNREVSLLGLLDLSAAFDCVDHDILLSRLEKTFGITEVALSWIRSFLTTRTQQVCFGGVLSAISQITCGVPQGSVLGPLLYLLYTAELFQIIAEDGLNAHSYADDTQVYISSRADSALIVVQRFTRCVQRIDDWMTCNRLKMNADKTQLIWVGTRQQLAKVKIDGIQMIAAYVSVSNTVSNLGVQLDDQLTMNNHVSALCRSCFFQLRQLWTVRRSLTTEVTKTLVHAFISSRLDYCNSLLFDIGEGLLNKLQHIQNSAARLVTGTRKFEHITPVLCALHWLPIRQRIRFKIATFVYKCLHGLAPSYLADDCILISSMIGRQQLRSASSQLLFIPRTRTANLGPRAFGVSGPTVWNSLPAALHDPGLSIGAFRKRLKTYLFCV